MKEVTITLVTAAVFLSGCTGRVQTNPHPDQSNYHLPSEYQITFKKDVDETAVKADFGAYCETVFHPAVAPLRPAVNLFEVGYRDVMEEVK